MVTDEILDALRHSRRPLSGREIAEAIGRTQGATLQAMKRMRTPASRRVIRIADWRRGSNTMVPLYAIGREPDEPQPMPLTPAERSERFRQAHAPAEPVWAPPVAGALNRPPPSRPAVLRQLEQRIAQGTPAWLAGLVL